MEREDKHFISGYLLTDQSSGQLRDSHRDTSLLRHKYMTQGKIHDGDSADTALSSFWTLEASCHTTDEETHLKGYNAMLVGCGGRYLAG